MAKQRKIKPRNPVARSPLLRKGGVHEKSRTSERSKTKREIEDKAVDWEDEPKVGEDSDVDADADADADSQNHP